MRSGSLRKSQYVIVLKPVLCEVLNLSNIVSILTLS